MRALFAVVFFLAGIASASAQVTPSGAFTPGHTVRVLNSAGTVVGDAGGAAGSSVSGKGYLTELGITSAGTPFCINDALTSGPYHQLCLGANALGGGLISYNAYQGATALGLNFNINGATYPFPFSGSGNVVGPNSSIVGDIPCWNNTGGSLLKDCGSNTGSIGGLIINPAENTTGAGLTINQSGPTSGSGTGNYTSYNALNISGDNLNNGTGPVVGLTINDNFGGTNLQGPRIGEQINMTPTIGSNTSDMAPFYTAFSANLELGGTPGGTLSGNGTGFLSYVQLNSPSSNWNVLYGFEADVGLQTGTTAVSRVGINLVSRGEVTGTDFDAAVTVGGMAQAWKTGIYFSNIDLGAPITTDGCLICTDTMNNTVATGIDFSHYTITGNFLAGPNQFKVDGSANIQGKNLILNAVSGTSSRLELWNGASTEIWEVGKDASSDFYGYDIANTTNFMEVTPAGAMTLGETTNLTLARTGGAQLHAGIFSSLPSCASGTEGTLGTVTDSTTNTWGATISGSGSDHVLAYCDGTNWTVAAK